MAIGFTEARLMAAEAVEDYREGLSTNLVKNRMRAKHPDANGFEINRAYARTAAIVNLEDLIRAGTPPPTVSLPYPLPPSSMGPGSPPNIIDIYSKAEFDPSGPNERWRTLVASALSGSAYTEWSEDWEDIIDADEDRYGFTGGFVSASATYII